MWETYAGDSSALYCLVLRFWNKFVVAEDLTRRLARGPANSILYVDLICPKFLNQVAGPQKHPVTQGSISQKVSRCVKERGGAGPWGQDPHIWICIYIYIYIWPSSEPPYQANTMYLGKHIFMFLFVLHKMEGRLSWKPRLGASREAHGTSTGGPRSLLLDSRQINVTFLVHGRPTFSAFGSFSMLPHRIIIGNWSTPQL